MALGTLDRTPPPFFRQGPSALTKVSVFAALAVFLMVADTRFRITEPLRSTLATALYPVQRALLVPVETIGGGRGYLLGLQAARTAEAEAREQLTKSAERAARGDQLAAENARLRALLELRPTLTVRAQAAEILYESPDPYSRKVVIDRGVTQNVALGSAVMNESGVLGQVTRTFLQTSEVTLLIDRDAAIPVLNERTGRRSAAFGANVGGAGMLEMRFQAANADVQPGDRLVTSGLDGVYPPGLPVAVVKTVDRKVDSGFARILATPLAPADAVRHVLVLEPVGAQLPPRPEAAASAASAPAAGSRGARKGTPR